MDRRCAVYMAAVHLPAPASAVERLCTCGRQPLSVSPNLDGSPTPALQALPLRCLYFKWFHMGMSTPS